MLGKLARRGLVGLSGGERVGLDGTLGAVSMGSVGTWRLNGAWEPKALERETFRVGAEAEAERGTLRSVAEVMKVFGS